MTPSCGKNFRGEMKNAGFPPPAGTEQFSTRKTKTPRGGCFHRGIALSEHRQDLGQHLAQPAASLQQAAHLAWSLQQLPLHADADLLLAQPVMPSTATAQNAASNNFFMVVLFAL
jgi:hypothetical protein